MKLICSELVELRSRTSLELEDLRRKVGELSLAAEKKEVVLRELKAEKEVSEENLKLRSRELREKMTALEAAERLVLELREEGMSLKERLVAVEREQDRLDKEKIEAQNALLKKTIFPEIKKLYGARKGCEMF